MYIQPHSQSPSKIRSSPWANFCFSISLLVPKTILPIPTNTPSLYNSTVFKHPIFTWSLPYNLLQKLFPYLIHLANWDCVQGPISKGHYFNIFLLLRSMDRDNCTKNYWLLIAQTQKIFIANSTLWGRNLWSKWQGVQSTFSHTLNLLLLLPYPTNTITRSHIPLESSCLIVTIFILKFAFSYAVQSPPPAISLEIFPSCHKI